MPPTLSCRGDEDRTTQPVRLRVFRRAWGAETDVTVDLSGLEFADTSLMVDLAMLARRLRLRGQKLLVHGATPQIQRLIEMVGLHRLPGVMMLSPSGA